MSTLRVVQDTPTDGIPCSVPMHRDYCMRVRGHAGTHLPWPPVWPVSDLEAAMRRHPAGKAVTS